jgi:hypothetical protein
MRRRRVISILVLAGLLASSCASGARALPHPSPKPALLASGVLTGTAQACGGLMYVPTAHLEVYRGELLVAAQRVPNNGTYRFDLPPGHYDVTNTGNPGTPSGHPVSVSSGRTSHLDVLNDCY